MNDDGNRGTPARSDSGLETPWSRPLDEIFDELEVDPEEGLSKQEAKRRRGRYGVNRLRAKRRESALKILVGQFTSVIVLILMAAMALAFAFGHWIEGVALAAVILANGTVGFLTELRAVRSMEALRELSRTETRVRRGGETLNVPAGEIVPGDIIVLEGGDVVPADLRILEAARVEADESALTGESVPVAKNTEEVDEEADLAERSCMLYKGTALTRGQAVAVAVATGMATELGQIAEEVEKASGEGRTPLEKRLDDLGKSFIWLTVGLSAVVAVSGLLGDKDLLLLVETAIALAVAAIPESMPIVATLALARGMRLMARENALVNRLSSVETLGSATAIFTDKTGTLTENRMHVSLYELPAGRVQVATPGEQGDFSLDEERVDPSDHAQLREALRIGALCNNADPPAEDGDMEEAAAGDPMETALLGAAMLAELSREKLEEEMPRVREVAFEPDTMKMATFHEVDGGCYVAVKGALEAVLEVSTKRMENGDEADFGDEEKRRWSDRAEELAGQGLRLLGLAKRRADSTDEDPYRDLTFVGIVGLLDPPREEVRDAIRESRRAGTRVAMVTGDQAATARKIALEVGLTDDEDADVVLGSELAPPEEMDEELKRRVLEAVIFARVTPQQKLHMIDVEQEDGDIVAMTGDGVNDAPALQKADIGIAMGKRGTQVAREAADMILLDDAFATIVSAIEQGRVIFANIRKFVIFLLAISLSMIVAVFGSSLLPLPLALTPLQVLFLNAVTHAFPALALGAGKGRSDLLARPPRDPEEPILDRQRWTIIAVYGVVMGMTSLAALWLTSHVLGYGDAHATTVSFVTLTLAQLWHVFSVRDRDASPFVNEVTVNPWVWGGVSLSLALLLAVIYVPGLDKAFNAVPPGAEGWGLAVAISAGYLVLAQIGVSLFGIGPESAEREAKRAGA